MTCGYVVEFPRECLLGFASSTDPHVKTGRGIFRRIFGTRRRANETIYMDTICLKHTPCHFCTLLTKRHIFRTLSCIPEIHMSLLYSVDAKQHIPCSSICLKLRNTFRTCHLHFLMTLISICTAHSILWLAQFSLLYVWTAICIFY